MSWMLYLVLLSPLKPLCLVRSELCHQIMTRTFIYPRPDLSWEGLARPWGSSVAVLGSGSACIQLCIFCSTAL